MSWTVGRAPLVIVPADESWLSLTPAELGGTTVTAAAD
jgi:hypothetical protein